MEQNNYTKCFFMCLKAYGQHGVYDNGQEGLSVIIGHQKEFSVIYIYFYFVSAAIEDAGFNYHIDCIDST